MIPRDPRELLDAAQGGSRVALARLLSYVEAAGSRHREVAALVYQSHPPYVVGITGPPGSGKSTLTDRLIATSWNVAQRGGPLGQIAVLCVDPSSPLTGGAILGDRIRMQDHATNDNVFIRSMATRGHLGGLSLAVPDALRVLGAAGFELVLVETVGVGQMEVEIASAADTTVVVTNPGWGDSMQASKAGLLEVADLFVINKADRSGVRETHRDLEQMLDLGADRAWRPPILETVASLDTGTNAVWVAVNDHRRFLESTGELARRRAVRARVFLNRVLTARLRERVDSVAEGQQFESAVASILAESIDPYRAADELLGEM